jgi:hypothetical protein
MSNNEHEGTRNLLRRSTVPHTPVGLEARVLIRIAEELDRKAKKRAVLSGLLQWTSIGLVAIAIGQAFLPGTRPGAVVTAAKQITENPGEKAVWLWQNTYFLIPLVAVYVFGKIYKWRVG